MSSILRTKLFSKWLYHSPLTSGIYERSLFLPAFGIITTFYFNCSQQYALLYHHGLNLYFPVRKDEHLFVCLLYFVLWNISSYPLFIFYLDCLFFLTCWVLRVLHVCSLYEPFDRNRDCGLSFHRINRDFCRAKGLSLDEI